MGFRCALDALFEALQMQQATICHSPVPTADLGREHSALMAPKAIPSPRVALCMCQGVTEWANRLERGLSNSI